MNQLVNVWVTVLASLVGLIWDTSNDIVDLHFPFSLFGGCTLEGFKLLMRLMLEVPTSLMDAPCAIMKRKVVTIC